MPIQGGSFMHWKQLDIPFENHPHCANMLYLAKHVNIHPLLGYHLFVHGIQTEEQLWSFLYPDPSQFHNPFLLNDMKRAVDRILKAIQQKKAFIFLVTTIATELLLQRF